MCKIGNKNNRGVGSEKCCCTEARGTEKNDEHVVFVVVLEENSHRVPKKMPRNDKNLPKSENGHEMLRNASGNLKRSTQDSQSK